MALTVLCIHHWQEQCCAAAHGEPVQAFQTVESATGTRPPTAWNAAARRVRRQRTAGLGEMFRNQIVQRVLSHEWPTSGPLCYTSASRLPRSGHPTGGWLLLAPKIKNSKPKIPPKSCPVSPRPHSAHRFLALSLGLRPASQDTLGLRPSPAPSPTAHASSFANLDGAESTGRPARPALACPRVEASVSGVRP